MDQAPEKMSDDVLLHQINCFDPYDVEFAKRYRAQAARIERLEAQVAAADALAEVLQRIDEASNHYAMTPTYSEGTLRYAHQSTRNLAREGLAAYNEAKKGGE